MVSEGLHEWFAHNGGKGWIDCKRSKPGKLVPCGRKSAKDKGRYPACRPTLSKCNGSSRKKRGHTRISWSTGRGKKTTPKKKNK